MVHVFYERLIQRLTKNNRIETLLDTGSLAGNFVLRRVVDDLNLVCDIGTKSCSHLLFAVDLIIHVIV